MLWAEGVTKERTRGTMTQGAWRRRRLDAQHFQFYTHCGLLPPGQHRPTFASLVFPDIVVVDAVSVSKHHVQQDGGIGFGRSATNRRRHILPQRRTTPNRVLSPWI